MLVAGAGAFGRNHIRVYRELEQAGVPVRLAAVLDPDPRVAAALPAGVPLFSGFTEWLASGIPVQAASVCVPTSAHAGLARQLLAAGVDVLVEKPLASTLADADAVIAQAAREGRILQVGHLERFNPAVAALEGSVTRPMFFEAHRLSVFTPRSLDVDVVLDLMIHDLDIVLSLAGSPPTEVRAVGLPVLSSQVDIANARIEFASGAVANFTASRVSTERVRKLRFFQPQQYISIDYARQDLLIIEVAPGSPAPASKPVPAPASSAQVSEPPVAAAGPSLAFEKPPVTAAEPLRLEIESFLESVRSRRPPRVDGRAGREALALALRIAAEIERHRAAFLVSGG